MYYDELTGNVAYNRYADLIKKYFDRYSVDGVVLDAGCGTGTLSLKLVQAGYDLICADSSAEMLSIAASKLAGYPKVILLNQQLENLDLYGTIKGAVATLDVINHIESIEKVSKVFSRISLFMESGGVFIFDINTPYKHSRILKDNAFVFETGDGMCVWRNDYSERRKRVRICLDIFKQSGSGLYSRSTDMFYEYTYTTEQIEKKLSDNNFFIIDKTDGESFGKVTDETQRITYIVGRK